MRRCFVKYVRDTTLMFALKTILDGLRAYSNRHAVAITLATIVCYGASSHTDLVANLAFLS